MKPHFINKISIILFSTVLFLSCSSELDFDQVDDFKIEPVLVANLAFFNLRANQIPDDGQAHQIPPDVEEFDVFRNKYLNKDLVKAELNFEIENTMNRGFKVELALIDANDQVLETINLDVPAYTGGSNIIKYPAEVYEGDRLALLKKTMKVGFWVTVEAGTGNISGNLKLKSGAIAYMRFE